jgi:hypothetical protein
VCCVATGVCVRQRQRQRQRRSVSVCFCVCVNVCGLKPCANTGEITGQCHILLGWQKSQTGTRQIFVAYDKTLRMPWYVSYNVFLPPWQPPCPSLYPFYFSSLPSLSVWLTVSPLPWNPGPVSLIVIPNLLDCVDGNAPSTRPQQLLFTLLTVLTVRVTVYWIVYVANCVHDACYCLLLNLLLIFSSIPIFVVQKIFMFFRDYARLKPCIQRRSL